MAGKDYIFTKTSQIASIGILSSFAYHTKQLSPWPESSASRMVIHSQLSACQGFKELFEGDASTCRCLTSLRYKPQQKQFRQLSALIPA